VQKLAGTAQNFFKLCKTKGEPVYKPYEAVEKPVNGA